MDPAVCQNQSSALTLNSNEKNKCGSVKFICPTPPTNSASTTNRTERTLRAHDRDLSKYLLTCKKSFHPPHIRVVQRWFRQSYFNFIQFTFEALILDRQHVLGIPRRNLFGPFLFHHFCRPCDYLVVLKICLAVVRWKTTWSLELTRYWQHIPVR